MCRLQRIDGGVGVALLLQVASEVEPRHRRIRRQRTGATPAAYGRDHVAAGLQRVAQTGMCQRIIRPLRDGLAKRSDGVVMALRANVQAAEQAQYFRVARCQRQCALQRHLSQGCRTMAHDAGGLLQMFDSGRGQAVESWFGGAVHGERVVVSRHAVVSRQWRVQRRCVDVPPHV